MRDFASIIGSSLTPLASRPLRPLRWQVGVFLLLVVGCSGPPKHPTWSSATGAEQYEHLMWQALHDRDWKSFEHRLAPAFIGVDPSGKVFDRAGWMERWTNVTSNEYSLGEVTVQPAGVDMVVTYVLNVSSNNPANSASGERLQVVSVWQQVKSGWIQTACSMTPVKAE
jgi:Domain of unknown function (DUF4440)